MEIYVVILNWNGKEDTLGCLASLEKVTTAHQVLVVDNGSTDDSVAAVGERFPRVKILENGENLGYAEGNNRGIRYALRAGADYVFILNNDTTVKEDILSAFLKNPESAIQGGKTLLMSDPSRLDHIGGNWNPQRGEFDLVGQGKKEGEWTESMELDYVCGVALFVKAKVFREIGLFEKRFFLFWEESDWCHRAKKGGYPASFCPEAKLFHKVSSSFIGGKPHSTYFWWRSRLLWISRNCSFVEKCSLFFRILLPEISRILKLYLIKSLLQKKTLKREKKIRIYRAALAGVRDFITGRFGNGPSWIFQK